MPLPINPRWSAMFTALVLVESLPARRIAAGVRCGFAQDMAVAGAAIDGAPPGAPVS